MPIGSWRAAFVRGALGLLALSLLGLCSGPREATVLAQEAGRSSPRPRPSNRKPSATTGTRSAPGGSGPWPEEVTAQEKAGRTVPRPTGRDAPLHRARHNGRERPGTGQARGSAAFRTPGCDSAAHMPVPSTSATVQETREAAPRDEASHILADALGIPENSGFRAFGWIQNSFTGNANGPGNGPNFGVEPNALANQWMGNQYYLVVENPLEQNDSVNFGFRVDNMFGNDWQFNYMQGLFNSRLPPNHFAGLRPAQLYGERHLPILTPERPRRQRRALVHAGRLRAGAGDRPPVAVGPVHVQLRPAVPPRRRRHHAAPDAPDQSLQRHRSTAGTAGSTRTTSGATSAASPGRPRSRRPTSRSPASGGPTSTRGSCRPTSRSTRRATSTSPAWPACRTRDTPPTIAPCSPGSLHNWTDNLTQIIETDQGWERRYPAWPRAGGTAPRRPTMVQLRQLVPLFAQRSTDGGLAGRVVPRRPWLAHRFRG